MSTAPRTFDDAKLAAMVDPLTVRVEKIKGTTRTPIPLPEGENGETPGTEWTKDSVRGLENFLVTQWSGGGLYEITVTDSSTPAPLTMKWSPFWNVGDYPELVPPPLAAARAATPQPAPPMQMAAPQPLATPRPMAAFPNGLPMFQQPVPYAAPQSYPQPYQGYAYAMPPPPQVGTPGWGMWAQEAEKRRESDDLRQLREENARVAREALAAKHAAELERERQANEARFSQQAAQVTELRNMIAQLATAIQNGNNNKPNAELELLKETNRRLAEQAENEKREREAERRERETRDALKAVQDANARQFELMQRTIETMQARLTEAANGSKSDPLITMLQEQARQHSDAIKEIARSQSMNLERIQAFMMNPRDMFMMAKESQSSVEQTTERISKLFGSVIDVQQKVTENLLQMQPGGSGALDVVRDGLTSVKELAERYVGSKATNERIAMQAQAQIAQAQAQAYAAAHGAQQAQVQAQQPQVAAPAPAGLAGNAAAMKPDKKPKKPVVVTATAGPAGETKVAQTSSAKAKRLGKTDTEWFGPLISNVEELREGVSRYLESLALDPPRVNAKGEPDGVSPEQAAFAVAQAVQTVMQHNLMIPVMRDLLFQDRFADFFDVLLPDAPQTYRDDTTQAFVELAKKLGAVAGKGEVEDQSEDGTVEDSGDDDDSDEADGDEAAA